VPLIVKGVVAERVTCVRCGTFVLGTW
jgi:hypothetical protein